MEYLKRKVRVLAQVRLFSDLENLIMYLEHSKLDILLLEEDLLPLKGRDFSSIHIVVLAENTSSTQEGQYPVIEKYQSAQSLVENLIVECSELNSWTGQDSSKDALEIIITYSLGCGGISEIFSFLLANEYGSMGNCLFINLEPFTGLIEGGILDNHKGMSDLIYYLNEKVENIKEKIELIIKNKDNIDVISNVTFSTDLCDFTIEGVRTFIGSIRDSNKYKFLIINTGYICPAVLELFQICSKLYTVTGQEEVNLRRQENFLKQLKWAGFSGILEKLELLKMSGEDINLLNKRYEEGVEDERVTVYIRSFLTHNI